MQQYHKHFPVRQTPQSQPIPGSSQVANNAGGFAWAIDDWTQLDRFLVLGTEGGTYYVGEQELTQQNAQAVLRCIKADGSRVVARAVTISTQGRAPKNDPALFVLAMCAALGDAETKRTALSALPAVARIGTHLFHFATYVQSMRGWGRGLRSAIKRWYETKTPQALAYDVTKYQSRDGWSHRDLLRLSHPKPSTLEQKTIYHYVVKGELPTADATHDAYLSAVEEAKHAQNAEQVGALIRAHNLPRECVPTQFLNDPAVWEALLERMPMTALVRNLGNLSKVGLLVPMSNSLAGVVERLTNEEQLHKSRIHPIAVLLALGTYSTGRGLRGRGEWTVAPQIVAALNEAFYKSFKNVTPTGKRVCLAVDGSGSMQSSQIAGTNISCASAAAALAMVAVHVEPLQVVCSFTTRLRQHAFHPGTSIEDAMKALFIAPEGTDGALPMLWAMERSIPVDAFVLFTDNETWAGYIHPAQALEQYRQKLGIQAKMIAVGMVANHVSVADPNDAGSLNVVGFDANVPEIMADFIRG